MDAANRFWWLFQARLYWLKLSLWWEQNIDVLLWLQSDVVRLWKWLRSPLSLYEAALWMPEYDFTSWQGAKWGYSFRGLFIIPEEVKRPHAR